MIDAIINFFTDNKFSLGISKFLMNLVNFKKIIETANELDDIDTIKQVTTIVNASISETPGTILNGDIAFLLLVQCANSDKWEVTVLNSKYRYLTKVTITVCLSGSGNADSYYIRIR